MAVLARVFGSNILKIHPYGCYPLSNDFEILRTNRKFGVIEPLESY